MQRIVRHFFLLLFIFSNVVFSNENDGLLIGAFNVRVFGQSKMRTSERVDVLQKVLSRYDIALVQEIRDSKQTAFPRLVSIINSLHSDQFNFVTGLRVGRTSSKEQYGFIFRKDKVEIISEYEENDEKDVFEREPLVVRFRRIDNKGIVKEFTMIALHAKPRDAIKEMNYLIDVYEKSEKYYGPNAIIAGDLNADCKYVCKSCWNRVRLRMDHRFKWLIPDSVDTTTTRTHCAYDRIILTGDELQKNACCARVFHFDSQYHLTSKLTRRVSDHYPIEFTLM